jgi:hypothetical protein
VTEPDVAVPAPVPLPVSIPASVTTVVQAPPVAPVPTKPTPSTPPPTDPPDEACDAGLLDSLGLDLGLTDVVKPLLSSVTNLLGGNSLLAGLTSRGTPTNTAGSLGDLLDGLLGSSCAHQVIALTKDGR